MNSTQSLGCWITNLGYWITFPKNYRFPIHYYCLKHIEWIRVIEALPEAQENVGDDKLYTADRKGRREFCILISNATIHLLNSLNSLQLTRDYYLPAAAFGL